MDGKPTIVLENGLDLSKTLTTGSCLHIQEDYDDTDYNVGLEKSEIKTIDYIGQPVNSFAELEEQMVAVESRGLVKKKILEEGGGLPLNKGCTVSIAFSGYWEKDQEPFDIKKADNPLVVDLNDNGLLPGLQIAVESMLVGEMSVFFLSYEVMYGKLGISPRVKPKANCVFYIKLIKSILTPKEGKIEYSESKMFEKVYHKVKLLYGSGVTLYKTKNLSAAIQLFRKAVFMMQKCRLADALEEEKQERMLIKLYTNQAICYNASRLPLKACIACNELNRLNKLWNNGKALFQNAKALRMIGQFDEAEKKLKRAIRLCSHNKEMDAEVELLQKARDSCNQSKLIMMQTKKPSLELVSNAFKEEVDKLIKNFKENADLCKLKMPQGLNSAETDYIKTACIRENLFYHKIENDDALDKDEEIVTDDSNLN